MMGHLDFTAGPAVVASLIAAALFPAVLAVLARLSGLRDRNALQFFASGVLVFGGWVVALQLPGVPASAAADLATALMILASALLIYLEAWALLSRGYTLTDAQLAASYRQGQGVGWIMRHRLGGLVSTRLVRRQDDRVVLTPAGATIGILYRMAIAILGRRVTG